MLNVSNPASRAHPTARTTDRTPCCRPNDANTCGTIDCTPNETRVPPARRYETSEDGDTLSGLHSTVTSAPGASRTSPSRDTSKPEGTSDGVPPPKKTEVAGDKPTQDRRTSARHASTYSDIR